MKSVRSKATDIPQSVKKAVFERDNGRCIFCRNPGLPEMHYISRQRGGLGIKENIVTGCRKCHDIYDFGDKYQKQLFDDIIWDYLKKHYPDLKKEDLYFKKWSDVSECCNVGRQADKGS